MTSFWLPPAASTYAQEVDTLFYAVLGVTGFVSVGIGCVIAWFSLRYRAASATARRVGNRRQEMRFRRWIEAAWIAIPLLLFLGAFGWAAELYVERSVPPPGAIDIFVVAKQWMWKLQHSDGRREINELHVPPGQPIKLTMTSQDVIHSFFVPAFRLKQDVFPGATRGCGSRRRDRAATTCSAPSTAAPSTRAMGGSIVVLEPADYARWLQRPAAPTLAARLRRCSVSTAAAAATAPARPCTPPSRRPVRPPGASGRRQRASTADERYIRDSILLPAKQVAAGYAPVMPSFAGQVGEDDIRPSSRTFAARSRSRCDEHDCDTARRRRADCRGRGDQLPDDRRPHAAVVALHARPQAHRASCTRCRSRCSSSSAGSPPTLIRIELATPAGDLVSARDLQQAVHRCTASIMVWFFLIPSIPSMLGNFLRAADDRRARPRVSAAQPGELVPLHGRRGCSPSSRSLLGGVDTGWTFYTPYSTMFSNTHVGAGAGGRLRRRLLVDPHRAQLHRHDAHDARAGHDLVPPAAVRLGASTPPAAILVLATPVLAMTLDAARRRAAVPDRRLRPGARRRSAAVPAPVLVLFAPGGVHHGAAGDGSGQRDHPLLRAQAGLRLPLHGLRDPGDRA